MKTKIISSRSLQLRTQFHLHTLYAEHQRQDLLPSQSHYKCHYLSTSGQDRSQAFRCSHYSLGLNTGYFCPPNSSIWSKITGQ
jgi:hypothetical protein